MKRFILKTLLLLLPIIVLGVSMEYLLRQIPNDYKYKKNYLDKHSKEIQLLLLGSSQGYYGITPVCFTQNTFNACHVSQSLDFDYEIFKKYQSSFDDLKVIVLSVSYSSSWYKLKTGIEPWRAKNYALYYGIDTKSLIDHSELLNGKLGINIKRLYNHYIKEMNDITCSGLGWGIYIKSKSPFNMEETGKAAALRHTYQDIYSSENRKAFAEIMEVLNSFAEFCNQKNVELILLFPPTYHTYWERLNKEQLNKTNEIMNDFAAKYNHCHSINWLKNPDFSEDDFYDADHLNETGAKKLSEKLACYIDSLGIFK